MAQVDIMVNDRLFKVTCEDGQEQTLERLARHFDGHVGEMARDLGQIGDTRLFLLAALTLCDELFEARARIAELEAGGDRLDPATIGGAARVIEAAAKRVEGMQAKIAEVA